ncbi:hypothetical protein CBR56_29185 [Bacillus thuringiensis]|nr:hypothetical protein BK728_00750 [Bacillus thuringiensis serovar chanpaisis]PNK22474.1 hypothetical protein CBR56_29185 [Bacillus thuringiensis]
MWLSKGTLLTLPTGEGAPQGLRGWGVGLRGSGEEFPSRFGQSPRFCFLSCRAWLGDSQNSLAEPFHCVHGA